MKKLSGARLISLVAITVLLTLGLIACAKAPAAKTTPATTAPTATATTTAAPSPTPTTTTPPKLVMVTVASSSTGSSGEAHAQNFAQLIWKASNESIKVSVVPNPSALQLLLSGTGDIAIHTNPPDLYRLVNGVGEYEKLKTSDMRTLWPSIPVWIHVLALADSKVNSINDIRGLTIASNLPGTNNDVQLTEFFTAAGIDLEKDVKVHRVGLQAALNEVRDGKADVAFFSAGHPSGPLTELEISKPFKLIEIPLELTRKVDDTKYMGAPVYVPATFKAGNFYKNFTKDVNTPVITAFAVTRKTTDPELVYRLTKLYWENKATLESTWAPSKQITIDMLPGINGSLWPIHDGALKYYRERGWKVN